MAPVQPETERSMSRRPETEERESSFLRTLTGPVARVIFALPFFVFGINHFAMTDQMVDIVPGFIPGGAFWVYLTGIVHLATAIAIMANRWILPAGIILALMLFGFVFTVHIPALGDPEMTATAMTNMLKDIALAGGALLAAHFAYHHYDDRDGVTETTEH